jgi:hypothetical protein
MDAAILYWLVALSLDAVLAVALARDVNRHALKPRYLLARLRRWMHGLVSFDELLAFIRDATPIERRLMVAGRDSDLRRIEKLLEDVRT